MAKIASSKFSTAKKKIPSSKFPKAMRKLSSRKLASQTAKIPSRKFPKVAKATKKAVGQTAPLGHPNDEQDRQAAVAALKIRTAAMKVAKGTKAGTTMKYPLPTTPAAWLKEIKLAIADASEAKPIGTPLTDSNLFHLAPHVCLKFRGQKPTGKVAKRVVETALANYIVNSDPNGNDHGLEQRPLMAFTLCYVAAHLALGLLNEQQAEAILIYCENHLEEG